MDWPHPSDLDESAERVVRVVRGGHYDVYVGRDFAGRRDEGWGNPFRAGKSPQQRRDAVVRYFHWLQSSEERAAVLRGRIRRGELAGKILACWCAAEPWWTSPCHGHVLAGLADGKADAVKAWIAQLEALAGPQRFSFESEGPGVGQDAFRDGNPTSSHPRSGRDVVGRDDRVVRVAAQRAAQALGVRDPVELVSWSMAACYVSGDLFLRVNHPGADARDAQRTLDMAGVLSGAGCAVVVPRVTEVMIVDGLVVECYQRLRVEPVAIDAATLGEELARFHQRTALMPVDVASCHRIETARRRLHAAQASVDAGLWRLACELVDGLADAVKDCGGETAILHGDVSANNMVRAGGRWVWVDLEHAGGGPVALDLAYALGEMRRFGNAEDAELFSAGYERVAGPVAQYRSLMQARDVLGVVDAVGLMWRSEHDAQCARQRVATFEDLDCKWIPLAG